MVRLLVVDARNPNSGTCFFFPGSHQRFYNQWVESTLMGCGMEWKVFYAGTADAVKPDVSKIDGIKPKKLSSDDVSDKRFESLSFFNCTFFTITSVHRFVRVMFRSRDIVHGILGMDLATLDRGQIQRMQHDPMIHCAV
ncbi:hypothetical protein AVEN_184631-1 [Araneus ventricosus]|uniref:Uncharacterized protein n=1 Tax=Araneus ventricosus TaxID=182803 RepID=A0A4Y2V6W7_ARAVE|nr:hypothetical protein AVEN_184631-1 [Araneus ventricosus]